MCLELDWVHLWQIELIGHNQVWLELIGQKGPTIHTVCQEINQQMKSKELSVDVYRNILWWGTDNDST